ncbi:prohibitin family protein [Pseudoduganella ginsengisoli]|nr:prohibitin family protein [Pseudoduganella ginsengisoli]
MQFRWIKKLGLAIAAIIVLFMLTPFAIVPAGHRGVLTTFGKPSEQVYDEGLHFRWPLAQAMHLVGVAIEKGEGEGDAASKDLQRVQTRVAINYHVKPEAAVAVYRDLGNQPGERIIVPAVHEAVKAVTARYTAEELISKRAVVRDDIVAALKERMSRHGLVIDEFSIISFNFSKTFDEAIEAKTTAEQLKMKAERDLQRIEVEAQQKVARAKAEADALALQRQQVTPELLRLREVENQAKAIEKWDGHMPSTMTGNAVPFINVPAAK